jgi:branched-chain amino acid transport system ATP-binding protein
MLEIDDLHVGYYKDLNVLQGVSVRARERQITAVLGPNGVGKSTLLKSVYGVRLAGQDLLGVPSHQLVRLGVAYIPQRQNVFPEMSVEENLEMGAWSFRSNRALIRQKIEANYARFPMLRERRRSAAGQLSGGMQRMVEIGRALMTDPRLLLVDEPTAGLAAMLAREMYDLLVQLTQEGITILLVDQNIRQAVKVADYVYVLELGRNRVEGPRDAFADLKKTLWL